MDALTYAVEQTDRATTVRLHGELCMVTVPGLRAVVEGLEFRWLILDLAELRFVDSSGIGFFVALHRECEVRMRRLTFLNVSAGARRVFDVVGVADLFDLA